ncbi:hypothetical protein [Flexivirga oryzae]|uniref:Uncharacterized protein n=1 Tax=Flexivirga oryzae TaxID=1794944 RepID=A0A839N5P7_9MICO|nr:hypothetical protein [Flexivirga oryzae]MBB2892089.1 hypothetical protein [Flexivirga oryzae]
MTNDLSDLAEDLQVAGGPSPADRSFHWHSAVVARGWEQPRLDGGNGGWAAETFCAPELVQEMDRENQERAREAQRRRLLHDIPGAGEHAGPAPRR